ncbi:hypothetical protein ACFE04_004852 [Oxalis oulophora]
MAADQRRKRLNDASIANGSSREQYGNKKKKLESSGSELHSKSFISLEWNAHRNKVVAKKEQIAMSRRNLKPFTASTPHSRNILADVLSVPPEVFQSENLTELLSYEVWQTLLSDKERNYLMQFLPKGEDAEQVVQALLDGENFNFGSPFLDWGVSLCSRDLHPDTVVRREQDLKAEKEVYYSEIQNYHHGMIEYLQNLKEKWEGNQDSEHEFLRKACRLRAVKLDQKHLFMEVFAVVGESIWNHFQTCTSNGYTIKTRRESEKIASKNVLKSGLCEVEQDITGTSESSSWMADEKACGSDNQNSSMMKGSGVEKRMGEKEKNRKLTTAPDNVKPKKGAKLDRSHVNYNDGSEHMSFIKVTKSQYEQIKSMKQSSKSIQLRSLNRVLGNPESLHVQPYAMFVKEEQKKFHEHWLHLAKEDLPRAHAKWRERQMERGELIKGLEQDMKDELHIVEREEKEKSESMPNDRPYESETQSDSSIEVEEEKVRFPDEDNNKFGTETETDDDVDEEKDNAENVLLHTKSESDMEDDEEEEEIQNDEEEEIQNDEEEEIQNNNGENPAEDMPVHQQGSNLANQFLQQSTCLNGSPGEFNTMEIESDKNPNCHDDNDNDDDVDVSVSREAPHSSCDVWPTLIDMPPHAYHETSAGHNDYTSATPSGISHVVVEKQCSTPLIDLESDLPARNLVTHGDSFNNSYTRNQGRSELLQSLLNNQGVLSYNNHEQKRPDVEFQAPLPHDVMMQDVHYFPKRQNGIFLPENNNIYPGEGSRFLMPRQEHFPTMPEWNTNDLVDMSSSSLQPNLNGGELLSQNWFPGEHQLRGGGWNGSNILNSHTNTMGNNGDQSLYSVMSQHQHQHQHQHQQQQQQQQRPCYDSMGISTTQQFNGALPRNNYNSMVGFGASNPHAGLGGISMLPPPPLPQAPTNPPALDYFGGRNQVTTTTSSLIMPDEIMGWPNLHDPMGKPYVRSWNQ